MEKGGGASQSLFPTTDEMVIRPQKGPQTAFMESEADIAIYGGAAGGGKTFALLIEPLRHIHNPKFTCVIFRNTYKQITMEGGMWDEAGGIYPQMGAQPRLSSLSWEFPLGGRVSFTYLESEKDKYRYQGAQIALLCWDQLEQFSSGQFFYLLSRNRSMCGVRPYVRATCNPQAETWLAELLSWWVNPESGYAIEERSGVLRWFARIGGDLVWSDSREALIEDYPKSLPKSLTFIPASVFDNRILLERDPGYLANLMALGYVDRERLAYGNWKIMAVGGNVFQRGWFKVVDAAPSEIKWVRFWDLAATEKKSGAHDPDWTAGAKLGLLDGKYYIEHVTRTRSRWHNVRGLIKQTSEIDGKAVTIGVEQEPGASGKSIVEDIIAMPELVGFTVRGFPAKGDKVARANPWAAQAEAGNVYLVRGSWDMQGFLDECEMFPDGPHDDRVDAVSGAVRIVAESKPKPAFASRDIPIEEYRGRSADQRGRGSAYRGRTERRRR